MAEAMHSNQHTLSADSAPSELRAVTPIDPRQEIVDYLRAHPAAADTVEGIVTWWLPLQRYENSKAAIQKALHDLVREGQVDEVTIGNGVWLYRLPGKSGKPADNA
jgi:hypothetical protein